LVQTRGLCYPWLQTPPKPLRSEPCKKNCQNLCATTETADSWAAALHRCADSPTSPLPGCLEYPPEPMVPGTGKWRRYRKQPEVKQSGLKAHQAVWVQNICWETQCLLITQGSWKREGGAALGDRRNRTHCGLGRGALNRSWYPERSPGPSMYWDKSQLTP